MKKKQAISYVMAGLVIPSGIIQAQTNNKPSSEKPNIIYILADDLGYGDLSCYGQTHFQTPNIDAMAKEGMRFTNHYAGCTVSAPSRASLMTGLHTGHTPIRGNQGESTPFGSFDVSLPANYQTVAECLKKRNYATGCVGKWGMGGPETQGHPNKQGFDYFYGHLKQLDAHFYYPEYMWENETKIELNKKHYSQDLFYEKAVDFIRSNKDNPFFLYFAVTIPHAELIVPGKDLTEFKGKFPEPNPWPAGQHYGGDHGGQSYPRAAFAAMVTRLDGDVGRIRRLLEELGIDKNTLIIFTSDNGPHKEGGADPDFFCSGGGLKGYKRDVYEGGVRVPMIATWKGVIDPGAESDLVSAFWDFLPTACEIVQTPQPKKIDGISFLPELLKKKQKKHDYLYWEFHENGGAQAVRMGNWKGVRLNAIGNPNAPIELYNLITDVAEENNVAAQYPEIVKQIEKRMAESHVEDPKWPFFK